MRRFLIASIAAAASGSFPGHAVAQSSVRTPTVRVALLQHAYGSGGFDRPLFLLLSDGRVLFPHTLERGRPSSYSQLALSPSAADSLLVELGVDSALYRLEPHYDFAPNVTDQHSFYLLLAQDTGFKLLTLRATQRATQRDTANLRSEVPAAFQRFYHLLQALFKRSAPPWTPDSVLFEIWPYEYAPDNPPLAWPRSWPGLESPRWRRRTDQFVSEIRALRLPFSSVPSLDSLANTRRTRQALALGGRKWAFGYRWIFPGEDIWWRLVRHLEQ